MLLLAISSCAKLINELKAYYNDKYKDKKKRERKNSGGNLHGRKLCSKRQRERKCAGTRQQYRRAKCLRG